MGFFVDLSALVKADDFPEEFESVVTAGKKDPNWASFLKRCRNTSELGENLSRRRAR